MPEGPSIIILKEKLKPFIGKRVIDANGYAKGFDAGILTGKTLKDVKSWASKRCLYSQSLRYGYIWGFSDRTKLMSR